MTESTPSSEAGADSTPSHPGLPRWVKVSALVLATLVVALIIAMLLTGGDHGPARHGALVG